jgi:predicted deacylase
MPALTLAGTTIHPGEDKVLNLEIARLVSHTPIDIRVEISRAEEPGPVLLLMGGLHGDEINGIEIVRRLKVKGATRPRRGTIITIPILNVFGFLNFSRDVPDGKDVNRSFPGNADGSLASRIAYTVTKEILPIIDLGVDYHTGGASRTNYPQVRSHIVDETTLAHAKAFGLPMVLDSPLIDGSLRKEAFKRKTNIIVYEGGESLRFDELAIREGVNGTLRLLRYLEMTEIEAPPGVESIVIQGKKWVRAKHSGFFHTEVDYGQHVQKGQVIGQITDPYGDFEHFIKSPSDGWIIGLNNAALTHQGDALYHIGW